MTRRAASGFPCVLLAVVLAACGGGGGGPPPATRRDPARGDHDRPTTTDTGATTVPNEVTAPTDAPDGRRPPPRRTTARRSAT